MLVIVHITPQSWMNTNNLNKDLYRAYKPLSKLNQKGMILTTQVQTMIFSSLKAKKINWRMFTEQNSSIWRQKQIKLTNRINAKQISALCFQLKSLFKYFWSSQLFFHPPFRFLLIKQEKSFQCMLDFFLAKILSMK